MRYFYGLIYNRYLGYENSIQQYTIGEDDTAIATNGINNVIDLVRLYPLYILQCDFLMTTITKPH
ncbi:hypothetical protein ABN763_17960 [Spongiivirga sp. MCCC 1A20706]|uniref:hypothetical protein n=1 Tax=Spongiivirga sp. MCCC 1A20706 TaxID=3160963 RepID=UPI003977756D